MKAPSRKGLAPGERWIGRKPLGIPPKRFAPFGDGRLMGALSVGSQGVAHGYSCAIPFGIEEPRHPGFHHPALALRHKW